MARKNTIRLLLINASDNASERLVSLFRGAGRVARAQRVGSAEELERALQNTWDLLIADDNHPELTLESCLELLRRTGAELPAIALRADADLPALFAAGARDVLAPDDDQRLVCAALREIETAELRRGAARLHKQLREAEQRNSLLLGEAEQAIAYIADGMLISANARFAERFGHAEPGDLDCVPIIDLIAAADHERFKLLLKSGDGTALDFTGQHSGGDTFLATLTLHSATFDDEACTQLIVTDRSGAAAAVATGNPERDAGTGLFSRSWLLEQLGKHLGGSLALIGIDQFGLQRAQLGYARWDLLLAELATFIGGHTDLPAAALARLGDDTLAVLAPQTSSADALAWAQQLCRAVDTHIVEFDGQSRHCTVSVGIAAIDGSAASDLLDRALSGCEQLRTDAANDGVGNGARVQEAERGKRSAPSGSGQLHALEEALEEQRFTLLFQPIISLRGASGEHYEVLLRMRGDTDTLELPDNFLAALGASADHVKLDRWILLEATKQLAANRATGNDTRLVINLTVNALLDDTLAAWLGVALKAAGLPPAALILQLQETDVVTYLKPARQFAETIRQMGCRFSIAGFGRVLDATKTLKSVPADLVQIDGTYTRALQTGGDLQSLKGLVSAVGAQDTQVIVPFVENASVLATLWQVGADFIQGHYLQAPSREMNYEFTDIA